MTVYEPEARIVRWIYKSFLSGNSRSLIQKQLQEAGIPSPSGKKNWCYRSILNILTNEKYYGAVCVYKSYLGDQYSGTQPENSKGQELVWWLDHHEPIISKEDFLAAQEEKKRRCNYEIDESGNRHRKATRYHSTNALVEM